MRRVFFFVFVLLLICEGIAFSSILHPLDLTSWTPYAENGSKVLSITPNEAIFKILRTVPGPKNTLSTDGYAYLISEPIDIGDDWGKVVIEGDLVEGRRERELSGDESLCLFQKAYIPSPYPTTYTRGGKTYKFYIYILCNMASQHIFSGCGR